MSDASLGISTPGFSSQVLVDVSSLSGVIPVIAALVIRSLDTSLPVVYAAHRPLSATLIPASNVHPPLCHSLLLLDPRSLVISSLTHSLTFLHASLIDSYFCLLFVPMS